MEAIKNMNNDEKEKLNLGLIKYAELEKELKSIESTQKLLKEEIQSILEKNKIDKYTLAIKSDKKTIICILYKTIKKDSTLLKKILKNFYCSIVRKKIDYLVDREEIEKLVKKGGIKEKDAKKLFSKNKYLKIISK